MIIREFDEGNVHLRETNNNDIDFLVSYLKNVYIPKSINEGIQLCK